MKTTIVVKAYNIEWEDPESAKVPKEVSLSMDLCDIEDAIHGGDDVNDLIESALSEYLSDTSMLNHNSFKWCFA
jgi:hypothetical protein